MFLDNSLTKSHCALMHPTYNSSINIKVLLHFLADLKLINPEEPCIYLCGHSLGLQPKTTKKYIDDELQKWATK